MSVVSSPVFPARERRGVVGQPSDRVQNAEPQPLLRRAGSAGLSPRGPGPGSKKDLAGAGPAPKQERPLLKASPPRAAPTSMAPNSITNGHPSGLRDWPILPS
jgi:hypothetical protein